MSTVKEKASSLLSAIDPAIVGGLDPDLQELLKETLADEIREKVRERREAAERKAKVKRAGIEMARAHKAAVAEKQARCNHMKPRNQGTRVIVTHLSEDREKGVRQYHFICQGCQKSWFDPPFTDREQTAPPLAVVQAIDPEDIGG